MARRQQQIPGTERSTVKSVEAAADRLRDTRADRMALTKTEKQQELELIAVMRANNIAIYKFDDDDGNELIVKLKIDEKTSVSIKLSGEEDGGDEGGDEDTEPRRAIGKPQPMPVGQALKDQAIADMERVGVAETADGDVQPPDKAAAPKKRGRPRKAKQ